MRQDDELRDGLRGFAIRLDRILDRLPASSPVLIHGDWGIGKTSLLHALERCALPRRPVVWFHAWRHEGETALLPALVRQIWEQTPEAYRKTEGSKALYRRIWNAALAVSARLLPLVLTLAGAGPVAATTAALNAGAFRGDLDAFRTPDHEPPEGATQRLWSDMIDLIRAAWPEKRPLILVDDLDRCSPEGAVGLLDGIRQLVTGAPPGEDGATPPYNFVVALDRTVVVQAISKKFADIGNYDGNRYLEKIFPLTFGVPAPYERDAARLVQGYLRSPETASLTEAERKEQLAHQDALSAALSNPLFANPRLMKRCINRFHLVMFFEREAQAAHSSVVEDAATAHVTPPKEVAYKNRTLARWIAATERWPQLRPLLFRHGDDYWHRLQQFLSGADDAKIDAEAELLAREPRLSNWLRTELFSETGRLAQFRDAELRLRTWGM